MARSRALTSFSLLLGFLRLEGEVKEGEVKEEEMVEDAAKADPSLPSPEVEMTEERGERGLTSVTEFTVELVVERR